MLQAKFTQRYERSRAHAAAALRDVPPVAGKILWARQIERRLEVLMRRMRDVLGKGEEQQPEGRELKGTCDQLLGNLDTKELFHQWILQWKKEIAERKGKERLRSYVLARSTASSAAARPSTARSRAPTAPCACCASTSTSGS